MSEEENKVVKKPFKGARVNWPPEMPTDMLEDAITVAKKALDEFDFEADGVKIAEAVKKHMDENYEPTSPRPRPKGRDAGACPLRHLRRRGRPPAGAGAGAAAAA